MLGLLLVGCSSPQGPATIPPAIDKLDMPATATLDATGHATLTGSVQFHDDDDNVVAVAIRLVKDGKESTGTLSTPYRSGSASVSAVLTGAKGLVVDYQIMVIDEVGHRSAPLSSSVTLQ